jgi:hypothetical protein
MGRNTGASLERTVRPLPINHVLKLAYCLQLDKFSWHLYRTEYKERNITFVI